MRKFEFNLSERSIEEMVGNLELLSKQLEKAKTEILLELGKYTRDRVRYYIKTSVNSEYSTEELYNSITLSEVFNDTISVYTDNAYAKYVEYGTGIVGASNPHPYMEGSYKSEGWWYPIKEEDVPKYKHPKQLEDGTWIVYTKGQVAHKFMYNALQDLRMNYLEISKGVLKKEGII